MITRNLITSTIALCTLITILVTTVPLVTSARIIRVGRNDKFKTITAALKAASDGDSIIVSKGVYKEGNIVVSNAVSLIGEGLPVLDGELKYEILSLKHDRITLKGFCVRNSGRSSINDPAAIKIYDASYVTIENNLLLDNFFGIYIQYGKHCFIRGNRLQASQQEEYQSGNGIHCWKSDSLQIVSNEITGHRDGIYFEFVTNSLIWENTSQKNLRYGLHFMFSHHDSYISNHFKNNGAGVAVMFTKHVMMKNNVFEENWGDAAYGLLFKEISDCYLSGNKFIENTTGVFFDGSNRIVMEKNLLQGNGWGLRLQASCIDNKIAYNNFIGNTFDVATNGTLTLNHFNENYWDKYEGYDLDKNGIGDVPYRPLSLFSVIVERNPPAMLLFRSFMVNLLDRSEKLLPSLTPENFIDRRPRTKPLAL
jgi:nitrous oxidase accessory protein